MVVLRKWITQFSATFTLMLACSGTCLADEISPEGVKFFETKIRPVLIKECYGCHSNKSGNARGGLRLDTRQLTHIGGDSGEAVVPGDLELSLLYNAIIHQDFVMPPRRKLPDDVIEDFRKWILMGAPDPRETKIAKVNSKISSADIAKAKKEFWAYKKPVKPETPSASDPSWPKSKIDNFVLRGLREKGLQPAEDAPSHKVLRRLCFDLAGLPPSPEQITYFDRYWEQDPDKAIRYVANKLLEKEQYGERWGRHWLDVVRYAESTGREVNTTFPHAWRYRDYVIDSFNVDKPYDRFLQEQIAGDLLPAKTDEDWAQGLIATTFLAMGPKNLNEANGAQFAADLVDEQIDTTTRVMLGTSVACARCHDHKFDPIPQVDYYALAGIFRSTETYFGTPASKVGLVATAQGKRTSNLIRLPVDDPSPFEKALSSEELSNLNGQLDATVNELNEARRDRRASRGQNSLVAVLRAQVKLQALSSKVGGYDSSGKPISFCMGVQERESPQDSRMLVRGEIDQPAQLVRRGFPSVLSSKPVRIKEKSSGRLELAKWIGSDQNPLAARVMVNRVWQKLIGSGIVTTTENFGATGAAPTHPELLDYLAVGFVESGWSVKRLIQEIVTSRTYRISSEFDRTSFEKDPENKTLWRANPRRVDAEALRDSMLFVSGSLDTGRPRASEVAKAGYMRVQNGNLFNPNMFAMSGSSMGMMSQNQSTERSRSAMRDFARRRMMDGGPGSEAIRARGRAMASGTDFLDMADSTIRSVYLPIVRNEVPRALEVFDFADPNMVIGTRESSNTPNQALFMMNNPFVIAQSDALARRVADFSSNPIEQIERAFVLAYGRKPYDWELSSVRGFVEAFESSSNNSFSQGRRFAVTRGGTSRSRELMLSTLCQSLFGAAEFRYID